ncbi:MAG: hypothetical protein ACKO5K_14435, partial [Armatimonadota bacterium]
EFAHAVHLRGMNVVDAGFDKRVRDAHQAALAEGLWRGTYASTNTAEYFAEGAQSWFDDNRENDHDHNHVNTRRELEAYDPRLAALCREVFGDRGPRYSKPATRLRGHLRGYDPRSAPRFTWPERLVAAQTSIRSRARGRARSAWATALDTEARPFATPAATYRTCRVEGWTVHVRADALAEGRAAIEDFLPRLAEQLRAVCGALPAPAVARLRAVPLWISPPYPGVEPTAEYHPDPNWLTAHGRDPAMAKGIEFTNVHDFAFQAAAQPGIALHELAHAWHDLVVGFGDERVTRLHADAVRGGRYARVERFVGVGRPVELGPAYAITDPSEYFAESTESFFLVNDYVPRDRRALERMDPRMARLVRLLWGVSD